MNIITTLFQIKPISSGTSHFSWPALVLPDYLSLCFLPQSVLLHKELSKVCCQNTFCLKFCDTVLNINLVWLLLFIEKK